MEKISRNDAKEKGLAHYFTGLPCKHGHTSKRRVSNSHCFECHLLANAEWRENNKTYTKDWYQKNKHAALAKQKIRYESKKEIILAKCKKYRDENRPAISATWLRWSKNNPAAFRCIQRKYEAKRRKTPKGKMTAFMRHSVFRVLSGGIKDGRCKSLLGYSPEELIAHIESQFLPWMRWDNYGSLWHVDHIVSISVLLDSGEKRPQIINALGNLRPLCAKENIRKGAKMLELI